MAVNNLEDRELMELLKKVSFPEFLEECEANFCQSFREWRVRFMKYAPFHYSSREIAENNPETAIQSAFDYLQLIASHNGKINICGVFMKEVEEVVVFDNGRDETAIRLAYSERLDRWFFGCNYKIYNHSGGGFAPSISARVEPHSAASRDQVEVAACEYLFNRLTDHGDAAEAMREKILRHTLEILSRYPQTEIPGFLKAQNFAVQQSLF